MPRTARATEAGTVYHVLNRGNGRMRLFSKPGDCDAFERGTRLKLSAWPIEHFSCWSQWVNEALAKDILKGLRQCAQRGRPLGAADWVKATAARLGLGFTLRDPGRSAKDVPESLNQ